MEDYKVYWVDIDKISPNPYQPRKEFDDESINALADSIRQYGVLQPLVVTKKEEMRSDGFAVSYELISGERRLRASKIAGMPRVPVVIKEGEETEQYKLEIAIIENIQREDLKPIDKATALQRLIDEFGITHSEAAKKVGKSRQYITNSLRLLSLPEDMHSYINNGEVSEGHATVLLKLSTQPTEQRLVFQNILQKKLTVKDATRLANRLMRNTSMTEPQKLSVEMEELERRISDALHTKVQIEQNKKGEGGKLHISYYSTEDLDKFLEKVEETKEETDEEKRKKEDDLYSLDNFAI